MRQPLVIDCEVQPRMGRLSGPLFYGRSPIARRERSSISLARR